MDINAIKQRLNSLQSTNNTGKREKIDYSKVYWKPKEEGKYQIRIVPSKLDPKNPFQEVFVHYGFSKFPIYALTNWGEKDPIVEFAAQLRKTNDKENWSLAKKLDPKMRVFAPVIVRGEEEKGVRLWEFGKEIYMQLLGIAEDEDYGDYTDINEGRDLTVDVVKGDIGGRQGLKSSIRVKPKTSTLSSDASSIQKFLKEQPSLLEIQRKMEFDALKEVLQTWLSPEDTSDDVVDEDEDETPVEPTPVKAYALKTPLAPKASKSDKFDSLFDEDEDADNGNDLPF
tara:strand:+ start:27 stop:878 length:852 start_codon:yes stop_codon:yes gene_type:complete